MRVVLDTNQYVSALLKPEGLQARLLRLWREGVFELPVSEPILAELEDVLNRPRFRRQRSVTEEEVQGLLRLLRRHATMKPGTTPLAAVPDDPTDNKIIACAVEGKAEHLVSGDEHLLSLRSYRNIRIMTAAEFLEQVAASGGNDD